MGLGLQGSCRLEGGKILLADKGYAIREFAEAIKQLEATVARPQRKDILTWSPVKLTLSKAYRNRYRGAFLCSGRPAQGHRQIYVSRLAIRYGCLPEPGEAQAD